MLFYLLFKTSVDASHSEYPVEELKQFLNLLAECKICSLSQVCFIGGV